MRRGVRSVGRVVAATVALGGLAGCADEPALEPAHLRSEAVFVGEVTGWTDERFAAASVRIASELVALVPDDEDVVVSPLSAQLALSLLREGASGTVASEVDAFVGLDGGTRTVADLRATLAVHDGDVAGIDPEDPPATPLLRLSDAAFVRPGGVRQEFLDDVARFHDADVLGVDFGATDARDVLDAWVREATGGLVEEAATEPDANTLAVLMNAAVLGASWAEPFRTPAREGPFTRADGAIVEVPLMTDVVNARHAVGDGWTAVELAYTDAFVMRLVLPDSPGAVGADAWAAAHAALDGADEVLVAVTVPRWGTTTSLDLIEHLDGLGLGSLRAPLGGLDGIAPGSFVDGFAQQSTITVSERGTVAAAVTEIAIAESGLPLTEIEVRFDRPFEYQVVHAATGTVPFAGRFTGDGAEQS